MADPILYAFVAPAPHGAALLGEIAAAGLPAPEEVRYEGGALVLPYASPLDAGQQGALGAVVSAHQNTPELEAQRRTDRQRDDADDGLVSEAGDYKLLRAVMLVLLDEVNALRGWLASFKAAVAASTSLADLKTRVAALPNTPDRTATQARNAVLARIDDGSADS